MRSGKDQTLMQQPYLMLSLWNSLEVFDEDWIQKLANQPEDHCLPLCVLCVGFQINLKTLKRFNRNLK